LPTVEIRAANNEYDGPEILRFPETKIKERILHPDLKLGDRREYPDKTTTEHLALKLLGQRLREEYRRHDCVKRRLPGSRRFINGPEEAARQRSLDHEGGLL
jgi:hypothetical protein